MFQVEADKKWSWVRILRGLFRLLAAWIGFVCWRVATITASVFSPSRFRESIEARSQRREELRTGQVRIRRR